MSKQSGRNQIKLKRLIRDMIREELIRIREEETSPKPAKKTTSTVEIQHSIPPSPPKIATSPRAVFGSPQPAPDRPLNQRYPQEKERPFQPDFAFETPPYLPQR
ncbi:hypothetical protein [Salinithrix halophila]|uniref:Uncharacterized protein n=1 Tax=Salinithrix halophila TaxID=1485204 RepID=A0ABV8JEA9_9BACL